VNLDGSIKSQLTNTSKQQDIRTTITVTAQGFDLAGDDALVGIGGTVEEKLTRIDQVAGQMGASLRADREEERAGGKEETSAIEHHPEDPSLAAIISATASAPSVGGRSSGRGAATAASSAARQRPARSSL